MAIIDDKTPFEQRVSEAILQGSVNGKVFEVEGEKYPVTEPTPATLMMVSAEVTKMPRVNASSDNILNETLRTAKDAAVIGRIAAVLILGARRIKEHRLRTVNRKTSGKRRFPAWAEIPFRQRKRVEELEWLSEYLLDNLTVKTLADLISMRLGEMQIGDFFGLTTSLSAVNILKATVEVEETAHGE